MTRLAIGAAFSLLVATTSLARAQSEQPTDDTLAAAAQAGLDPMAVQGAVNDTHMDPWTYLCAADGLLCPAAVPPAPACDWPICGPLGRRLFCIEQFESRHNGAAVNRSSGAAGYLQWLPSTAHAWGVVVGNRWSEWNAASRIASMGEAFFRSQWPINAARC